MDESKILDVGETLLLHDGHEVGFYLFVGPDKDNSIGYKLLSNLQIFKRFDR